MQTVSLETAKRLQELGLAWTPREGDFYVYTEEPEAQSPSLVRRHTLRFIHAIRSRKPNNYTWLLRLGDVLDEIERLVPDAEITFAHGHETSCYVERNHGGIYETISEGHGPTDTQAAGIVLAQIMEVQRGEV